MTKRKWLEDSIEEYIKNNQDNNLDSVDIVQHFHLGAEIIFEALTELINDNKVERKHIGGIKYAYYLKQN